MKITNLSLAAIAAMTITTGAMAEEAWDFNGQAVAYTQSVDAHGTGDLFSSDTTYAATGLQLGATNKNLVSGFGAGFEVSAIGQSSSLTNIPGAHANDDIGNPNNFAFPFIGGGDAQVESAAITQAYITYNLNDTFFKVGRQTLPKSLSPFAYSEGWQMFKNTMDAGLVVNKSVPDTTLVYAAVGKANSSIGNLGNFDKINENGNVVHMVTAQNKSVSNLTLTGTYYYAPDMISDGNDANILWGDAKYKASGLNFALQGGQISGDTKDSTTAWGAKVGGKIGMINASVAYSSVGAGDFRITNFATVQNPAPGVGIKSPLYTQQVLNNIGNHQAANSDWIKVAASAKVLGGKVGVAYGQAMDNNSPEKGETGSAFGPNPYEFDLTYKTKLSKDTTFFAAYVLTGRDRQTVSEDSNNFLRFWARYSFN